MHQGRICQWLGLASCTHNKTFLDLPAPVRRRIYDYAGLFSGESIYLYSLDRRHDELEGVNHKAYTLENDACDWCDRLHFTFHLLQTCRAIYAEVSAVVYSENRLLVPSDDMDNGLRILSNITPYACSKLTNLYVHLNLPEGYCPRSYILKGIKVEPILKSRIAAWKRAAEHVLAHSDPQKLRLHLSCEIYSQTSIVPDVLAPLFNASGSLRDCAMNLGEDKCNLYTMARQAAITASYKPPTVLDSPFRFLDLPQELQQAILKYTDLVTPSKEVRWAPQRGFYYRYPLDNLSVDYYCSEVFRTCADSHYELGTFCMRWPSSYSSRCRCWRPPQALFLVSRAVYETARVIFYSQNRVVVMPIVGLWTGRSPLLAGLETSTFITKSLRPDTLSHLRYLELVCPPFRADDPSKPSDAVSHVHWQHTIDYLRTHSNLSVLTIAIYMTRYELPRYDRISSIHSPLVNAEMFVENVLAMGRDKDLALGTYLDIVLPFQSLTRLKRFFVFIEWAGRHCFRNVQLDRNINCHLSEAETWLEQKVMGSEYDSRALGKMAVRPSQWLQTFNVYYQEPY
ncbi:hypothetical protein F4811DRAFT_350093 [Daldinia bambusicola]|nr:hypothetical protein F4811DRAFT_350093 [Daldinia bambusicola]